MEVVWPSAMVKMRFGRNLRRVVQVSRRVGQRAWPVACYDPRCTQRSANQTSPGREGYKRNEEIRLADASRTGGSGRAIQGVIDETG